MFSVWFKKLKYQKQTSKKWTNHVSKTRLPKVKDIAKCVFEQQGKSFLKILQHIGCRSLNTSYLEIGKKPGISWLTYQPHNSSADSARELFKPSKDSASLQVCNEKKNFFCE